MPETLEQWIAGGGFEQFSGRRIFVREEGPADGAPVTLVHGFPTCSHDWEAAAEALAGAGHRVLMVDLLGFGASEKPHRHRFSIKEQASIVEAFWASRQIERTALVCHDYGVSVGQELIARDPERIAAVAWLNGGLYADLHRPLPVQRLLHAPAGPALARLATERTFRSAMLQIMGRPPGDPVLHEMWLSVTRGGGRRIQPALLRYIDDRREFGSAWERALEGYEGPTLCIWGPADPVSGAHVLPRLRERLPQAQIIVLDATPPVGHYPQVEGPDEVASALVAFLAQPATRRPS
jgi:pimeloyl-ACP methyl ester carboxylesterase